MFEEDWGAGGTSLGAQWKESTCQGRRHGFDPWVGKIPWRRKWPPTPVFFLENPMDRGAWWATVHGVTESWTRLSSETATAKRWGAELEKAWNPGPPHWECRVSATGLPAKPLSYWWIGNLAIFAEVNEVSLIFDPTIPFLETKPADSLIVVKNSLCTSL